MSEVLLEGNIEIDTPQDPTVGPCLSSYGVPREKGRFPMSEVPLQRRRGDASPRPSPSLFARCGPWPDLESCFYSRVQICTEVPRPRENAPPPQGNLAHKKTPAP